LYIIAASPCPSTGTSVAGIARTHITYLFEGPLQGIPFHEYGIPSSGGIPERILLQAQEQRVTLLIHKF
jgi:hypothetical protein